jgi:SAM-dependent methyltransferase
MTRLVRTVQLIPQAAAEDRVLEMGCYLQITPALQKVLRYSEVRGCYLGSGGCERRVVQSRGGETFECLIDLFDAEIDEFPYASNYFNTLICAELLEHLQYDPMHMLSEINRVLRPGGLLVLTTPNAVSLRATASVLRGSHPSFYSRYPRSDKGVATERRHAREYTPSEVSRLLTDSGFVVFHIETGQYGKETPDLRWAADLLSGLGLSTELRGDCIYAIGRKAAIPRERFPSWLYDE